MNGRPFLPRSRRTLSTTAVSCITHPSWFLLVHRLCPFALWTVISGLQIGRTLPRRLLRALRHPPGPRPDGGSHVHTAARTERDLGIPLTPFNAPTGHRPCAPPHNLTDFPPLRQLPPPLPAPCLPR